MALRTDYKDDVLDTSINTKRKYNLITNDDGTVSLEDATTYLQVGDSFGAQEMNELSGTSELSVFNQQTLGYTKKNLIPYPYYETTVTREGITFTDNGDGTVTANGTATAEAVYNVIYCWSSINSLPLEVGKTYKVTGCPDGGSSTTYSVQCVFRSESDTASYMSYYNTDGLTFTANSTRYRVGIRIIIESGTTVTNLTFKPMLRDARILDDTYEPYVEDVDTRIVNMNSDLSQQVLTFTNKTVATSAWAESGNNDFPYYADVTCSGVTSSYVPNVNFSLADANSGIFSTVAETVSGVVRIYASEIPSATITIPTIQCIKSV